MLEAIAATKDTARRSALSEQEFSQSLARRHWDPRLGDVYGNEPLRSGSGIRL